MGLRSTLTQLALRGGCRTTLDPLGPLASSDLLLALGDVVERLAVDGFTGIALDLRSWATFDRLVSTSELLLFLCTLRGGFGIEPRSHCVCVLRRKVTCLD